MRLSGLVLCVLLSLAGSLSAAQGGPTGLWNRDDGKGGVRIARCGAALCGHIVWLRDAGGPAQIGERVLWGMRQTAANVWSGSARNPEDGGTYAGTLTVSGDQIVATGCAMGGLICQSVPMTRGR